ncbi:MAG: sporulation transcriptional regulator SpoIIID [Clostridia bacterium]|nr:sporulation transcriptional regulator SpoIIID [Clostridia bacterium]
MNELVEKRAEALAEYIIETKATVRAAAKRFDVSKSTVHTDVSSRLKEIDHDLYERVRLVLDENKAQRHIRGGNATKEKYRRSRVEKG